MSWSLPERITSPFRSASLFESDVGTPNLCERVSAFRVVTRDLDGEAESIFA
jgi:hypothetical protein